MRIAELAPIWESVPPEKYGGTELVLSNLTEKLVARGHEVTLFASGDSKTSAKLVPTVPKALYRAGVPWSNVLYGLLHTIELLDRAPDFDIVHAHLNTDGDYATLIMAEYLRLPVVTTIHLELPVTTNRAGEWALLSRFRRHPFISISDSQRTIPDLNYLATVYNGIAVDTFPFCERPQDYLAWLGRFCPEKGAREAIEVARQAGLRLILAGKVDQYDETTLRYFEDQIKPQIDSGQIIYLGELDHSAKVELLGQSKALLNPLLWHEPFGLVTVEAMACGTPVITLDRGPVRELIVDGKTGFFVSCVAEMAASVARLDSLDRQDCRDRVEQHFSARTMAERYEQAYLRLLSRRRRGRSTK